LIVFSDFGEAGHGPRHAGELGLIVNAVNVALHEFAKRGAMEMLSRGWYRSRENMVALALLDRVERLERRISENRAAGDVEAAAALFGLGVDEVDARGGWSPVELAQRACDLASMKLFGHSWRPTARVLTKGEANNLIDATKKKRMEALHRRDL